MQDPDPDRAMTLRSSMSTLVTEHHGSSVQLIIRAGTRLKTIISMIENALDRFATRRMMFFNAIRFEGLADSFWTHGEELAYFTKRWRELRDGQGMLSGVSDVIIDGCAVTHMDTAIAMASVLSEMRVGCVTFASGSIPRPQLACIVSRLSCEVAGTVFMNLSVVCDDVDDDFLQCFARATSLDLHGTKITDAAITHVARLCYYESPPGKRFETLDVRNCTRLTPLFLYGLQHLMQSSLYSITQLHMTRFSVTADPESTSLRHRPRIDVAFTNVTPPIEVDEYDERGTWIPPPEGDGSDGEESESGVQLDVHDPPITRAEIESIARAGIAERAAQFRAAEKLRGSRRDAAFLPVPQHAARLLPGLARMMSPALQGRFQDEAAARRLRGRGGGGDVD